MLVLYDAGFLPRWGMSMHVWRFLGWTLIFGLGLVLGTSIGYQIRPFTPVVTAAVDLPAGTAITRPTEQLRLTALPTSVVPHDAICKVEDMRGKVLGRALEQGTTCRVGDLSVAMCIIGPADSLPAGKRAITLTCDLPAAAVQQVVGCRVDLVCTMVDRESPGETVTVTFLENQLVLAVNQRTERTSCVTLAAAPQDVARIVWAKNQGNIDLVMRPPGDDALRKPSPVKGLMDNAGSR